MKLLCLEMEYGFWLQEKSGGNWHFSMVQAEPSALFETTLERVCRGKVTGVHNDKLLPSKLLRVGFNLKVMRLGYFLVHGFLCVSPVHPNCCLWTDEIFF